MDLEALSREAAGCLPKEMRVLLRCGDSGTCGCVNDPQVWLHESTEACTEIMVRLLWPAGVYLRHNKNYIEAAKWFGASMQGDGPVLVCSRELEDADPILAFRVAVLRALVALKKG